MSHIHFNSTTQYGALLRNVLRLCEQADDGLDDIRDVLIQMRSGDGSENEHYTEIVKRFWFSDYVQNGPEPTDAQCAVARAAFEEIDSAYSKTSGNGQVSDVRAARDQLYAKLRG